MYAFARRRNRLTIHFSERIPVVKRRISMNWNQVGRVFFFFLWAWTFGLEISTGRVSTGRTLCVLDGTLRNSTCHWHPEVVGVRTATLCVHFLNVFCLDMSLSSRNVLIVYPTLHFLIFIMFWSMYFSDFLPSVSCSTWRGADWSKQMALQFLPSKGALCFVFGILSGGPVRNM